MEHRKLIVVGSGAGGLSAAITAHQKGLALKDILVLEKREAPGGNASIAPVFPVAGDDGRLHLDCQDDRRMLPDDPRISDDPRTRMDANFKAAMEWTHWATDARLIRTLITKSEETSDWLRAMMDEDFVMPERELGATGALLLHECAKLGLEIRCGVAVKTLLRDETGRVYGVLADDNGREETFCGDAVVVSTGGFFGNPKLMERYFPDYKEDMHEHMYVMGIQHTGDGLQMALDSGALCDGTAVVEWSISTLNDGAFWFNNNDFNPEVMWVNSNGDRFGDESMMALRNSVFRQPQYRYYVLHDQKALEHMVNKDEKDMTPMAQKFNARAPLYADYKGPLEKRLADGKGVRVNTIEEIADYIGCDPKVFSETVAYYNASCDMGYDRDFLKDAKHMLPLRTPPFYVWKETLNVMLTHGPVKVNRKMELLQQGDKPIPGCYYAGLDIGGADALCYACCVACHSMSWSLASGRIAGESAAAAILAEK